MDKKKRDVFGGARRLWRERRPVVVSLIVLLAGLPVVILLAQANDKAADSPAVNKAIDQFRADTEGGDYDAAYQKLKSQEGQATTKQQQVELYSGLAASAANLNKLSEAIGYLEKKHQVDPSTLPADAYMLATLYQKTGDNAKALEYYKRSLEYYKSLPSDPALDSRIRSLEALIAEMESADEQ